MLTKDQMLKAADILIDCAKNHTLVDSLPEEARPLTRAEGYAIQECFMRETRHPLVGWKLAATSEDVQKRVQVDEPFAGRILREHVVPAGGAICLDKCNMKCVEFEFAFRIGKDLVPRSAPYGREEVMEHVAALRLAIEAPDCRYRNMTAVGGPQLIADNGCIFYFVFGPDVAADWRKYDLVEHQVKVTLNGQSEFFGKGGNVLGEPALALTWLANELSGLGITLKAGELVSTGACLPPLKVAPGDNVVGDFGDFGSISVNFV